MNRSFSLYRPSSFSLCLIIKPVGKTHFPIPAHLYALGMLLSVNGPAYRL